MIDPWASTSVDYDKNSETTKEFFKTVQKNYIMLLHVSDYDKFIEEIKLLENNDKNN